MKPGGDVYRATRTTRFHTWFIGRIITLEMIGGEADERKLANVPREKSTQKFTLHRKEALNTTVSP